MTLKTMITNLYTNVKQDIKGQRGRLEQFSAMADVVLLIVAILMFIITILITIVYVANSEVGGYILIWILLEIVYFSILILSNKDKIHERKKQ